MRPVIVGIGGSYSGAGKTSVASLILRTFKGWGAIKYTKTSLYASIVDDLAIISQPGKDTKKLLDAGAGKVIWVKSPSSELGDVLPAAVEMVSHLPGVVVEGNSAIELLRPDIVIFVCGHYGTMKSSARNVFQIADIVIFQSEKPPDTPRSAICLERDNRKELMRLLSALIEKIRKNNG